MRVIRAGTTLALVIAAALADAAVRDVMVTDVTPSAFTVVWASDEPVLAATTVNVFADEAASTEITGTSRCTRSPQTSCIDQAGCSGSGSCHPVVAVFESPPAAAANGVVKVTVTGLGAGQ